MLLLGTFIKVQAPLGGLEAAVEALLVVRMGNKK